MKVDIKPDGDGYLATIDDKVLKTFAWGKTKPEALSELQAVVDAIVDIRLEEIEKARKAKKTLQAKQLQHTV